MPASITLDSVSLSTPDHRPLASSLSLAFGRERTGIVGRNGSGKSTLLRVIVGEVAPAGGAVRREGRIAMMTQTWADPTATLAVALDVAAPLAALVRIERGEALEVDFEAADWTLPTRLDLALAEAGLPGLDLARPIATLSGGERTRLALARLQLDAPDIVLMDEPTNNLDAEGRTAVADFLAAWRGGAIVASHDRALLETMDRVLLLTPVHVSLFTGPWSAFATARADELERVAKAVLRAEDDLRHTERAVQHAAEKKAHRDKAARAQRARGGQSQLYLDAQKERAEHSGGREARLAERLLGERQAAANEAKARVEVLTPLHIDLPHCNLPASRLLIEAEAVRMAADGRHLFGPLSFAIRGPARVALRGRNGAGKTTLIRLITGEITPHAGTILRLTDRIAVLDQHVGLLDPTTSVLDNLRRLNPMLSDNAARTALARFAFRNTAALQTAGSLSGGERLRAGLACAFAQLEAPELLILDEPTNHLDLDSIALLETALQAYDGAILVVSHDEAFLDAIGVEEGLSLGGD
jgi:ATPase subunit of ABC transporter with duplicated ATPase domains